MRKLVKNNMVVGCFWLCIVGFMLVFLVGEKQERSLAERRKLKELPTLTLEGIQDKSYMEAIEEYLLDHFPARDWFRSVKAHFSYDVLRQKENNDIYVADGYAGKLEYPLHETSVYRAAKKMQSLQAQYFPEQEVYYAIIPDKNYFLAQKNGYPSMDYDRLREIMQEELSEMTYIDIWDTLSIEDYYTTDTHWRQERLQDTSLCIGEHMGFGQCLTGEYEIQEISDFYGVYYGQSALPLSAEQLYFLTNDTIKTATQWSLETDKTLPVYIKEEEAGIDKYNIFLSGAQALQVIKSPLAKTQKRLIVFRDSFASSIVPLWLEAYEEIVLIDIRYIHSDLLDEYVDFDKKDTQILFLYNTLLLNNSSMLK